MTIPGERSAQALGLPPLLTTTSLSPLHIPNLSKVLYNSGLRQFNIEHSMAGQLTRPCCARLSHGVDFSAKAWGEARTPSLSDRLSSMATYLKPRDAEVEHHGNETHRAWSGIMDPIPPPSSDDRQHGVAGCRFEPCCGRLQSSTYGLAGA
ncbi:hypothetical protein FA13DRAFT_1737139 [Coprinellus micaceus]|uniref:Uncharacterized protein n=1 Tax=Coprinellus micaceus TaxID=71717 RepID=A0A4Y7SYB8_COPMI|nr:hypothetical protein FA13DRAFT_1737139 [Coprinellus micaceus]